MLEVYIDADGCPVKEEVYRVARRHALHVHVVSNSILRVPNGEWVHQVLVSHEFDAVDDWIVERIGAGDIAITGDVRLAARCLAKGARAIGLKGQAHTEESIGGTLATRDLMDGLRQMGAVTGGPAPMSPRDRSRFLSRLEEAVQAIRRHGR
ncbi:MAG: YaiI/YqxD family protein [Planctomycetes bacterium]|nr:YaiI/YqxD family protein [Planctomycetota bacterium]